MILYPLTTAFVIEAIKLLAQDCVTAIFLILSKIIIYMKLINRVIVVSVIIVFALVVFPTLTAPSDTGGIVSASDNQTPSDTNSVRTSNVTDVDEPADPPLKVYSDSISISKSGNDQQQFVAIVKDNMSVNSSELTTFAEVGTVSESRA